ncbi:LPS export ABC transporter periplasmic protein LptC [Spirulina sp. 06S082]|uniref:LPS export ABC transporter periplasmic protein LptC n=1 Tax=Spirulina sp. 06S082 TaxID=3110248 RepID=UPI002B1EBBC7|nr:LPS export ABC transporter periplasmic protein LptC [Spirulina sp. 06S082]MEA5469778.1 LPS export ABC transporter periplasmic protein LptC [Spirulina sp. 06S082]
MGNQHEGVTANQNNNRVMRWIPSSTLLLLLVLSACQPPKPPESTQTQPTPITEKQAILEDATIENTSETGELLWRVNAKNVIYSEDGKSARFETITGNVLQNDELIVQLSADRGEMVNDGEKMILHDNIIVRDLRNGAIVRGKEMEWLTKENLIIARDNFTGSHEELEVTAKEGRYFTLTQRLELKGKVIATGTKNPMQMRTEEAVWELPAKKLTTKTKMQADRYDENKKITDRILADKAEMNLETQVVVLQGNVRSNSVDPPVQVASDSIIWNMKGRSILANKPVRIVHNTENTVINANEGLINLKENVARLKGGVRGINASRQADLYANEVVWAIDQRRIDAQGNIIYKQVNPPLEMTGTQAVGAIDLDRVTVTRGENKRVVTQFVPNSF